MEEKQPNDLDRRLAALEESIKEIGGKLDFLMSGTGIAVMLLADPHKSSLDLGMPQHEYGPETQRLASAGQGIIRKSME